MARQYRRALVVGKFAPFHKGHQAVIDRALEVADKVLVLVWSNPDFPDMPNNVRAQWIRDLYSERVRVETPRFWWRQFMNEEVIVHHRPPPNDAPQEAQLSFTAGLVNLCKWGHLHDEDTVDVVVSSEPYGKDIAKYLMMAGWRTRVDHVTLDRTELPVSGTMIREDVHQHRGLLDRDVYAHFVEQVVFMGAESTGKSTLVEALAGRFQTSWVHEYGRTYYEEHGGVIDLGGYVKIATHHQWLEERAKRDPMVNRWVFVDTNAITTQMFSYLYERAALPELKQLADGCVSRYKHWFVCDDDIPFEQDGWRDCELARSRVQGLILQDLDRRGINYTVLRGSLAQRVKRVEEVLLGR